MPFNTLIQRSDVAARIPSRVSNIMLNSLYASSAALAMGTRIPLPAGVTTFPVLSALPQAYWVTGDTGVKQTTTMAWAQKTITVEEVAAIVPIPDNVFDDVDFDVWEAVRPALETAIARVIDSAIFLGTNKPASFPAGLAPAALALTPPNSVVRGTAVANDGGLAKDLSDLIGKLEAQGYYPNKGVANPRLRGTIRNIGLVPQQLQIGGNLTANDWFGAAIQYPESMAGLWNNAVSQPEAIVGDFSQMVVGVRSDFRWKLITEGVITDGADLIQYNLPQQDMTALRVTFRMGWQVANPINFMQQDPTKRFPFGVLVSPGDVIMADEKKETAVPTTKQTSKSRRTGTSSEGLETKPHFTVDAPGEDVYDPEEAAEKGWIGSRPMRHPDEEYTLQTGPEAPHSAEEGPE